MKEATRTFAPSPGAPQSSGEPRRGAQVGSYLLLEALGAGGMSIVYRAEHGPSGRHFALKIPRLTHPARPLALSRLRCEARAAVAINHPNVVRVFEYCGSGPTPFLALDLLEGVTLRAMLEQLGTLPPARAAGVVRDIATGLAAAHRSGFVHCDLKPGNVMLTPAKTGFRERATIMDLGIARSLRSREPDEERFVLGTPSYMAPEQFHDSGDVRPAADLYALGAVLYQMLAGHPPFRGSFNELAAQHVLTQPAPLPDAGGLEELAFWLLEKDPAKRPPSAERVVEVVERFWPLNTKRRRTLIVSASMPYSAPRPRATSSAAATPTLPQ